MLPEPWRGQGSKRTLYSCGCEIKLDISQEKFWAQEPLAFLISFIRAVFRHFVSTVIFPMPVSFRIALSFG